MPTDGVAGKAPEKKLEVVEIAKSQLAILEAKQVVFDLVMQARAYEQRLQQLQREISEGERRVFELEQRGPRPPGSPGS